MAMKVQFEIGHTAKLRSKKTAEGFTHNWELYVQGVEKADINAFVEKVVFNLHDSFPKPKRVCKEPPYIIQESGYAGFLLPIDIYFRNRDEPKRVQFTYDLDLQHAGPPHQRVEVKKFIFECPSEEFRLKLLKGGGVPVAGVVGGSSSGGGIVGGGVVVTGAGVTGSAANVTPTSSMGAVGIDEGGMVNKPKLSSSGGGSELSAKKHKSSRSDDSKMNTFANLFGTPITKSGGIKHSPDNKIGSIAAAGVKATGGLTPTSGASISASNPSAMAPKEKSNKDKEKSSGAIVTPNVGSAEKSKDKSEKKEKHHKQSSPHKEARSSVGSESKKSTSSESGGSSSKHEKRSGEEKSKKDKSRDKERERSREKGSAGSSGTKRPFSPKTAARELGAPSPKRATTPTQKHATGMPTDENKPTTAATLPPPATSKSDAGIREIKTKESKTKEQSSSSSSGKKSKKEKKDKDKDKERDKEKREERDKEKHRSSETTSSSSSTKHNKEERSNNATNLSANVHTADVKDVKATPTSSSGSSSSSSKKSDKETKVETIKTSKAVEKHADKEANAHAAAPFTSQTNTGEKDKKTSTSNSAGEKDKKSHKHKKKDKNKDKDKDKERDKDKDKEKERDKEKLKAEREKDSKTKSAGSIEKPMEPTTNANEKTNSSKVSVITTDHKAEVIPAPAAVTVTNNTATTATSATTITTVTNSSSGSSNNNSSKKSQSKDKKSKDKTNKEEKRQQRDVDASEPKAKHAKNVASTTTLTTAAVAASTTAPASTNLDLSDVDSLHSTHGDVATTNNAPLLLPPTALVPHSDSSNSSFPELPPKISSHRHSITKSNANKALTPTTTTTPKEPKAATPSSSKEHHKPRSNSEKSAAKVTAVADKSEKSEKTDKSVAKLETKEEKKRRRNSTAVNTFIEPPLKQPKKELPTQTQQKQVREKSKSPALRNSVVGAAQPRAAITTDVSNNAGAAFLPPPATHTANTAANVNSTSTNIATSPASSTISNNNSNASSINAPLAPPPPLHPASPALAADATSMSLTSGAPNNTGTATIAAALPTEYLSELQELHHKIMTLQDNEELQQVVEMIAATGCYEITAKTFDFDLCKLDRTTVQRLQEFFATSVS